MKSTILEEPHASGIVGGAEGYCLWVTAPSNLAKDIKDLDTIRTLLICETNILTTAACLSQEPEGVYTFLAGESLCPHWSGTVKDKFKNCSIKAEEKPTQTALNLREMCNLRKPDFQTRVSSIIGTSFQQTSALCSFRFLQSNIMGCHGKWVAPFISSVITGHTRSKARI